MRSQPMRRTATDPPSIGIAVVPSERRACAARTLELHQAFARLPHRSTCRQSSLPSARRGHLHRLQAGPLQRASLPSPTGGPRLLAAHRGIVPEGPDSAAPERDLRLSALRKGLKVLEGCLEIPLREHLGPRVHPLEQGSRPRESTRAARRGGTIADRRWSQRPNGGCCASAYRRAERRLGSDARPLRG